MKQYGIWWGWEIFVWQPGTAYLGQIMTNLRIWSLPYCGLETLFAGSPTVCLEWPQRMVCIVCLVTSNRNACRVKNTNEITNGHNSPSSVAGRTRDDVVRPELSPRKTRDIAVRTVSSGGASEVATASFATHLCDPTRSFAVRLKL